jgi:TonB family protein
MGHIPAPWEKIVPSREINGALTTKWLVFVALTVLLSIPAQGENDLTRKVKTKVPPEYPVLARRMNIRGTVKVLVVVDANGNVRNSRVVGGNPILVNSAVDAVKKWKFEPAAEETTGVLEFRFDER